MKMIIAVLVCMITITSVVADSSPEMAFRIQGHMAKDQLDWDGGSTLEFQARFWATENVGTAISMGFGSWTARSEYTEDDDMAMSVYGSVAMLPVGLSVLYRNTVSDNVSLLFEAGLRYVLTGSDLNIEIGTADSYYRELVELDDTFLAVLGISLETRIDDGIAFEFGMGYQVDLMNPHEYFLGEDAGETSFQAATVNLGITWAY